MSVRLYPSGYGTAMVPLERLADMLEREGAEPEYRSRLLAWLYDVWNDRHPIGIGDAWRATQPDQPGFAPDGKSFHQTQTFEDGSRWFMAVDAVVAQGGQRHRAPYWSEVPPQDSTEASTWGIHANVTGEPWHLQAIEVDGWQTWVSQGRRRPEPGYPFPGRTPDIPTTEDTMILVNRRVSDTRKVGGPLAPGRHGFAIGPEVVPATATRAWLRVTVDKGQGGFVNVLTPDGADGGTSVVNRPASRWNEGTAVVELKVAPSPWDGRPNAWFDIYTSSSGNVVVDVVGYWTA